MTASFADPEIWHVLIASDDMKRMNVDQLDDAFRLSLVDTSTLVWKAGMKQWQRLGSVADIEEEPEESITRMAPLRSAPPPPPRPLARPAPKPPSRAPNPFMQASFAPSPFAQPAFHTAVTPVFASPLVAPVYTPQLTAPDPYVLPKRRVAIPSEVDFRRSSGGVRWGRWLVALLLLTGGVLGAYRQNLLREGARRMGIENKYLYSERRAIAFVNAKAPYAVKNALTRLALLPGPNALQESTAATLRAPEPAPAVVAASEPTKPSDSKKSEPEVKTVSLDSLPVLRNDAPAIEKPAAAAIAPVAKPKAVVTRSEPKAAAVRTSSETPRAQKAEKAEKPAPVAKAEPEPKAKPEPKPTAVSTTPVASDSFLKAAIRASIAADSAKKK